MVTWDDAGLRLDQFLNGQGLPASRSMLKRHIEAGVCQVNGEVVQRPACKLHAGDEVSYLAPAPAPVDVQPEDIPLQVLHEARGETGDVPSDTLVNALLGRYADIASAGAPGRAGIVHRLDKDTSGVMVAARTDLAHAALAAQFSVHSVDRRYDVLVLGRALQRYLHKGDPKVLGSVEDVAWEMEEGSICGLGIAAPLPLTSAMTHFPAAFEVRSKS